MVTRVEGECVTTPSCHVRAQTMASPRSRRCHADTATRCRRATALAGDDSGIPPRSPARNKGMRYPADPPAVEEIVAVMRTAGPSLDGIRLRALMVILWRAGLRITEALSLAETDLDAQRGSILIRRGKGGKRREVGM